MSAVAPNILSAQLAVEGMHCAACAGRIEKALRPIEGVERAAVNVATHRLHLTWDNGRVSLSQLRQAVSDLGFALRELDDADANARRRLEKRTALKRIAVAGIAMMQVMTFAVALYAGAWEGIEAHYASYLRLVSMLVTLPVVFYSAAPFFGAALRDLAQGRVGMDVPVSLAIVLAFAASVFNALRGSGEVYFDSVTMFVFFLLLGRFVEMQTRHKAGSVTQALAAALPRSVLRLRDGRTETVALAALEAGDTVVVPAGAVIPADGIVALGNGRVDESLLTGESTPISATPGRAVIGGSLNVGAPLQVTLSAVGDKTVLAHVVRLVERAQSERPRIALAADRAAAHFVVWILAAAVIVCALWLWLDPPRAFSATLALLVVTCPCALSLATPAALAAATSHLARSGLLVTRADAIERLALASRVVFDKTGTITQGAPQIARSRVLGPLPLDRCLTIAAALEDSSEHPLAAAFRDSTATLPVPASVNVARGAGISGVIDGERYRIGSLEFAQAIASHESNRRLPAAAIFLGSSRGLLAAFEMDDALREGSRDAVRALNQLGVAVEIASGDHAETVQRVADHLGVESWRARLTPEAKLERIRELDRMQGGVVMVGDGINDAPVLGAASVSIAIGTGSALAQASADLILTSKSLLAIPAGITVARRTLRIMRQNLAWAAAYNLAAIPLAAMGWIAPWAAAIGMSLSSIFVVLNAGRLAPRPAPGRTVAESGGREAIA
jgi:Cu2+-exporting ATPase